MYLLGPNPKFLVGIMTQNTKGIRYSEYLVQYLCLGTVTRYKYLVPVLRALRTVVVPAVLVIGTIW